MIGFIAADRGNRPRRRARRRRRRAAARAARQARDRLRRPGGRALPAPHASPRTSPSACPAPSASAAARVGEVLDLVGLDRGLRRPAAPRALRRRAAPGRARPGARAAPAARAARRAVLGARRGSACRDPRGGAATRSPARARRPCSSPTTRPRRSRWAARSPSCAPGGSSRRGAGRALPRAGRPRRRPLRRRGGRAPGPRPRAGASTARSARSPFATPRVEGRGRGDDPARADPARAKRRRDRPPAGGVTAEVVGHSYTAPTPSCGCTARRTAPGRRSSAQDVRRTTSRRRRGELPSTSPCPGPLAVYPASARGRHCMSRLRAGLGMPPVGRRGARARGGLRRRRRRPLDRALQRPASSAHERAGRRVREADRDQGQRADERRRRARRPDPPGGRRLAGRRLHLRELARADELEQHGLLAKLDPATLDQVPPADRSPTGRLGRHGAAGQQPRLRPGADLGASRSRRRSSTSPSRSGRARSRSPRPTPTSRRSSAP